MNPALIDYGAGNLRSVANALRELGVDPVIASTPEVLRDATHLILPGVGSFGDCMAQLQKRELLAPIQEWVRSGKPYLGICLGYQILFETSEESPGVNGLGLVAGHVRKFSSAPELKIPHMGWNSANPQHDTSTYWQGLGANPYFYFVHSYFPQPADPSVVASVTTYGDQTFASAIEMPGLIACQFHPEKSQEAGLRLMANFLDIEYKQNHMSENASHGLCGM